MRKYELLGMYADSFGNLTKVFYDRENGCIVILVYKLYRKSYKRVGYITVETREEAKFISSVLTQYLDKLISVNVGRKRKNF